MSLDAQARDNPRHAIAVKAARARWGEPRILRLDKLTAEQRRLVLALLDAAKSPPDA